MTEEFIIQSNIANIPVVEERLFHFCHQCNVGSYYSAVSVATLQAVNNAIVHGNASNPSTQVALTFGTCRGGIYVEVSDQGAGFDFEQYGQLPADDSETGTGIFVMKSLSDKLLFSDGGRRVRMEFVVAGIDPAEALERISVLSEHFAQVAA